MKRTICVDFDGVIADYSQGYQGRDVFGEPLHGAGASMAALKENGWRVIIFTTRPDTPALRDYLDANGIAYDYINVNPDQPEGANPGKPIADLYLDDRAFRFKGWADFRYALDAMVKEKVLESATSGEWLALKGIFEGAITADISLLTEWWEKIWPTYQAEGYTKDEIQGYIQSGNWDADHLRNDIAEYDAKYSPGIVLADSAGEEARLTAIKGIQKAPNFAALASWFASAFDVGPASLLNRGISDAARNLDAIFALAERMRALRAVHDDENADIDDRLEATREFNTIVGSYNITLDNGDHVDKAAMKAVTGVDTAALAMPIEASAYSDLKLSQYRDEAQNVCARAGVAPKAALRRIQAANEAVTRATEELNAKASPITLAYQRKLEDALWKNGYEDKKKEIANLAKGYQALRDQLATEKPNSYSSYDTPEEADARWKRYEEYSAKMQGLWDEQNDAIQAVKKEMQGLYEAAQKDAGDLDAELAPLREEYQRVVEAQNAEIAAARAEIGKIKDHVISVSPVSKEAADAWFDDMVLVSKNMQGNLKKRGYDAAKLKETMTEFYRMTGGRLARIEFATKGGQRAAAMPGTGVVYVAGTFSKRTFFHEMAHILEDDERTRAVSNRFLDQRTGRDKERKTYTLKSLTGNKAYGSGEVAFKDSFIDPYVGKYYRDGITEVFSMGVQYFTDPAAMAVLLERDPDHFNFMLGYMATPPRLDKSKVEAQQKAMTEKKDAAQSSDTFLKELDKKIAKAGDFWTKEGFTIDSWKSWRGGKVFVASWTPADGRLYSSGQLKSEKNLKRMLWLHIAAGKPADGPYSISRLSYDVFDQKNVTIPKDMTQDPFIKGAAL